MGGDWRVGCLREGTPGTVCGQAKERVHKQGSGLIGARKEAGCQDVGVGASGEAPCAREMLAWKNV